MVAIHVRGKNFRFNGNKIQPNPNDDSEFLYPGVPYPADAEAEVQLEAELLAGQAGFFPVKHRFRWQAEANASDDHNRVRPLFHPVAEPLSRIIRQRWKSGNSIKGDALRPVDNFAGTQAAFSVSNRYSPGKKTLFCYQWQPDFSDFPSQSLPPEIIPHS